MLRASFWVGKRVWGRGWGGGWKGVGGGKGGLLGGASTASGPLRTVRLRTPVSRRVPI